MTLLDFLEMFKDTDCGFVIINNKFSDRNLILTDEQIKLSYKEYLTKPIIKVYPYAWNWDVIFEVVV